MDLKKKIHALRKRSVEVATLAATLFPLNSGLSASLAHSTKVGLGDEKMPSSFIMSNPMAADVIDENVTLNIDEFKQILGNNPDIELSSEILTAIQPGPSQKKIRSMVEKGFDFTIRNSRGESKKAYCSLHQPPKGYCYGALKRILNRVYKQPISGNLSAYQEKDNLLESSNFLGMPINLQDIINCPPNTIVVIPKCKGHPHGHIFTVVEKGVYCSDGKEVAGSNFDDNYKDAKGIYAFVPTDGSITLTPKMLQQSPDLYAAILQEQTGKEIAPIAREKDGQPLLFAELNSAQKSSKYNR